MKTLVKAVSGSIPLEYIHITFPLNSVDRPCFLTAPISLPLCNSRLMEDSPQRCCLLSDPEIGIITENDHKVGKCLCNLCTCGHHLCPSLPVPRFRSYATSYQRSYKRLRTEAVKKFAPYLPYYAVPGGMELRSSMRTDYQAPRSPVKAEIARAQSSSPKYNFIASSSYAGDYLDWGPAAANHEKRPNVPSRLGDVKFAGTSTYQQHYIPTDSHSFEQSRSSPTRARSIVGLSKVSYDSSTTHQRMYPLRSGSNLLNPRYKQKPEELLRLATPPCHHITTHNSAYRRVYSDPKDPAVLRRRKLPL